jgi:hypothetical protein
MENKSRRVTGESEHNGNRRGTPLLYLALAVSYTIGIYWLSTIPGDVDPESPLLSGIIAWTPPALQNLLHVPLFGLLAGLWYRTLHAWNMHHGAALTIAFMLATGYGVFDEWHQLHIPGRYASFTDIALNGTGVILALWWVHRWKRRRIQAQTDHGTTG